MNCASPKNCCKTFKAQKAFHNYPQNEAEPAEAELESCILVPKHCSISFTCRDCINWNSWTNIFRQSQNGKNGSTAAISRLRSAASFVVKSQILREWSRSPSSAFSIPHFLVKRAKPPARQRACYPSLDALPRITSFSLSPRARDFAAVFIVVSRSDRQKHQCGWSIQISSSNSYLKFLLPSTS